jgi:hypothetical protein
MQKLLGVDLGAYYPLASLGKAFAILLLYLVMLMRDNHLTMWLLAALRLGNMMHPHYHLILLPLNATWSQATLTFELLLNKWMRSLRPIQRPR